MTVGARTSIAAELLRSGLLKAALPRASGVSKPGSCPKPCFGITAKIAIKLKTPKMAITAVLDWYIVAHPFKKKDLVARELSAKPPLIPTLILFLICADDSLVLCDGCDLG
jgi:hypothetical protein